MYKPESPRLSPLWLSASSSACHGLLIITATAITYKAQRDKNAETGKLANAAITDMQMRQRNVLRSMQNTQKVSLMLKLKMMSHVMMLPLVVVWCCIKAVCQSVREATTASGVDNAASPDWQTPLNGIISPSERG